LTFDAAINYFLNRPPNCPDCKRHISKKLDVCPFCGYQITEENQNAMAINERLFWQSTLKSLIVMSLFMVLAVLVFS
jgi:predicted amidophosphoribosyltransferase